MNRPRQAPLIGISCEAISKRKDFANYGLFVFDWRLNNGPYVKKSAPNGKIDSELKSKILKISGIPKLQMDFSKVDKTEL